MDRAVPGDGFLQGVVVQGERLDVPGQGVHGSSQLPRLRPVSAAVFGQISFKAPDLIVKRFDGLVAWSGSPGNFGAETLDDVGGCAAAGSKRSVT